jgi:hypothetical protein
MVDPDDVRYMAERVEALAELLAAITSQDIRSSSADRRDTLQRILAPVLAKEANELVATTRALQKLGQKAVA